MLPLHGFAKHARGFRSTDARTVFRLRSPNKVPTQSADVALIRYVDELCDTQSSGFETGIIVSDNEALFSKRPFTYSVMGARLLRRR